MKCLWAFSTFAVGGPQRRFASLVDALGPDYSHVVFAMDGDYEAESLLNETVCWRRIEAPAEDSSFVSRANVKTFRRLLAEAAPDLLLTSNWGTIEWRLANRTAKVPHIHFEDGFGPDEAGGRRRWKRDAARRLLFSSMATGHSRYAFVAPSTELADLLTRVWRAPAARVRLIPNGVDVSHFAAVQGELHETFVIGTVGALRPEKRIDRLLRVFAAVRQEWGAELLIVGDGPSRSALETMAKDLSIEAAVTFAGAQDDVAPFLKRMDVFAITSDTEQMPISVVEAMAAGLPVVGADVGDIKMMTAETNRWFIHHPIDERAMTRSLGQLLGDCDLRQTLGEENAVKAAAAFSLERMTTAYRELFDAVARKASRSL